MCSHLVRVRDRLVLFARGPELDIFLAEFLFQEGLQREK